MAPIIRPAQAADLTRMVELAEGRRAQYQQYQPVFWRPAPDARAQQAPYFAELLTRDNVIVLVAATDGEVDGFLIATLVPAPPVYDPGGLTCLIDDFCVATPTQWATVGPALLQAGGQLAKARGAIQFVVVCGYLDEPKGAMLQSAGLTIASAWYTGAIG